MNDLGSKPPFYLNKSVLYFSTKVIGTSSESKSYTLKTFGQTGIVYLHSNGSFSISLSPTGPFADTLSIQSTLSNIGVTVYVRYHAQNSTSTNGQLTHMLNGHQENIDLVGHVISDTKKIGEIQGNNTVSPLIGKAVTVRGIVTMDLQAENQSKGFYLQSESDGDSNTSDGIFVYNFLSGYTVQKGSVLEVSGEVTEYYGLTELIKLSSVKAIVPLVPFALDTALLSLPVSPPSSLEKYESMLIKTTQQLVVTETHNLGRYGELTLSPKRLYQPTETIDLNDEDPNIHSFHGKSNVGAITAQQAINDQHRIVLNDWLSTENPDPVPFIDTNQKTIRSGSLLNQLYGIVSYEFGKYRLYPLAPPIFQYAPRPPLPTMEADLVKVASMNALNFFNGNGDMTGFPTSRGASTYEEFKRQKSKIVAAIKELDADIITFMEIENDGKMPHPALNDLIDALSTKYLPVQEPLETNGNAGSDEIKIAMIYQPSRISLVGSAHYCNDTSFSKLGRPPLAQTFQFKENGQLFTLIGVHLKSKGCTDATGDDTDQSDGQGCYNTVRKNQAASLTKFADDMAMLSGDRDVLLVGDFNAYGQEDPLDLVRSKGFKDLTNDYSYQFDGQTGALDHAFATPSLYNQVLKTIKWHINSDEPNVIDYTTRLKSHDLYTPNPYRSSDHDPILIGLQLHQELNHTKPTAGSFRECRPYPNPMINGQLYFDQYFTGELVNENGVHILSIHHQKELSLSQLSCGTYFLKSLNGVTHKLVIR